MQNAELLNIEYYRSAILEGKNDSRSLNKVVDIENNQTLNNENEIQAYHERLEEKVMNMIMRRGFHILNLLTIALNSQTPCSSG
jgi:hypothetical protein